ncbi:MAG: bifunctional riboflavin kinase/FAD synthetase [Planifilum fulgidum]
METVQLSYPLDSDKTYPPAVLAIGYFDGVHRGHQSVIRRARELAARLGVASAVMTFHPHPREVLGKSKLSGYITPLPDKLHQFALLGVDRTYVMKFDRLFADRTKEQFVEEVLIPLQVHGVVVGFNFCFGRGASGRAEDLKTIGEGRFRVEVVTPVLEGEIPVSSTRLREALAAGDVVTAEKILGRPHSIEGKVVSGDRRGRTIGFPTANLDLSEPYAVPKRGVYLVSATRGGRVIPGVMNIGLRPTFRDPEPKLTLEVHLLDFEDNLYGEILRVHFHRFLREERRFGSADDLVRQIREDVRRAEAIWPEIESGVRE